MQTSAQSCLRCQQTWKKGLAKNLNMGLPESSNRVAGKCAKPFTMPQPLLIALVQWKTLLEETTVIIVLGESQPKNIILRDVSAKGLWNPTDLTSTATPV